MGVIDPFRVEVHLLKFLHHLIEQVGVFQLIDLRLEFKMLQMRLAVSEKWVMYKLK